MVEHGSVEQVYRFHSIHSCHSFSSLARLSGWLHPFARDRIGKPERRAPPSRKPPPFVPLHSICWLKAKTFEDAVFYDAQSDFSLCVKGLKMEKAQRYSLRFPLVRGTLLRTSHVRGSLGLMHFWNLVWCCLLSWWISAWLPLFPFWAFLSVYNQYQKNAFLSFWLLFFVWFPYSNFRVVQPV